MGLMALLGELMALFGFLWVSKCESASVPFGAWQSNDSNVFFFTYCHSLNEEATEKGTKTHTKEEEEEEEEEEGTTTNIQHHQ